MAFGEHIPAAVIPYQPGHDAGYPVPAQLLVDRYAGPEEVQRLPQNGQSGRISVDVVFYQTIEQKVGCAGKLRRPRCSCGRPCYFHHTPTDRETTGKVA